MAREKKTDTGRPGRKTRSAPPRDSFGHRLVEGLKTLAVGFLLFMVLRTFVIQTFRITSGSMEETLLIGDFLVLSKSAYGATVPGTGVKLPGYTQPQRGDVVVFRGHHEPIDLVKRLVGLPGDTLSMQDGVLYVNGDTLPELYAQHSDPGGDPSHEWMRWQSEYLVDGVDVNTYRPTRDNWGPLIVPAGRYFMLGDNRDESLDSRYWGFVDPAALKGKCVILYFSFDSNGLGAVPFFSQIRWGRIGDRVD